MTTTPAGLSVKEYTEQVISQIWPSIQLSFIVRQGLASVNRRREPMSSVTGTRRTSTLHLLLLIPHKHRQLTSSQPAISEAAQNQPPLYNRRAAKGRYDKSDVAHVSSAAYINHLYIHISSVWLG